MKDKMCTRKCSAVIILSLRRAEEMSKLPKKGKISGGFIKEKWIPMILGFFGSKIFVKVIKWVT